MSFIKKETITQKAVKNVFYNFLTTIIAKFGALIFTIIIARILFPELFGLYSIALTIILTIATFTDLGINATLIRYIAEPLKRKTKKTEQKARSRLYFLLNFKIALTAIVAIILFLVAEAISIHVFKKPALILPLQIGSIYLFTVSLYSFFNAIFYAVQKLQYSVAAETSFQILRIALVFVFFLFYKSVSSVFVVLAISFFIAFVFSLFMIRKKYYFLLKGPLFKLEKEEKKRLLSFFGWLTISSISFIFFTHMDTFMLGIFLPAQFAGFYHAIFSIIGAVVAFVAFGSVLLPVFTQIETGRLERGFKKALRYTALIAIPAAMGLAFIIVPAIQVIYGSTYVPLQYRLAITIASALLSFLVIEVAFTALYSALFQAKEKPKIPTILIVIATVANIILNYIFIKISISIAPQYGLVGVAAATLISRYTNMITLSILTKKKLNIKTEATPITKPLIASTIMLAFLFFVDYFITLNIGTGILMVIAAIAIYFGLMWLIKGTTAKDFEMIKLLKG